MSDAPSATKRAAAMHDVDNSCLQF